MQKSSQCSQIAVSVAAWGQIFGKEYDAIKFVCGKGFGKGVGVRHVDDSETVIAVYGAFAFRYHHMVSGKGMLNPLFGNEIGITDQKHFHATAPVNIPLTGLWHSSAHKPSIVPVLWYSSVIRQQTNSPFNGGFLVISK